MPISKMSGLPNSYRYMVLCLDNYDRKVMRGRMYHPVCEEGVYFSSTMELLCEMESMCDAIAYPKASLEQRRFQKTEKVSLSLMQQRTREHIHRERRGALGTFLIRVCFRQNASWQGTVQWLETGKELKFRSTLELLMMMDSALTGKTDWEGEHREEETGL